MDAGAAIDAERVTRYVAGRVAMRPTSATTSTPRAMPIFFSMEEGSGWGKRSRGVYRTRTRRIDPGNAKARESKVSPAGPCFFSDVRLALEPLPVRVRRRSEADVALIGDRTVHHAVGVRRRVDGSEDETDAGTDGRADTDGAAPVAPAAVAVVRHVVIVEDHAAADRRAGDRAAEHVADDGTGRRGTRLDFDDFVGQAGRPGCRVRHFRIGNGARGKREC